MQKAKKEKHFIKKPVFPGGRKAMLVFIKEQLQYPAQALENQIEGTVHLRFEINQSGVVPHAKIISGIGFGCDEEALRVVKSLKFDVPKNRRKNLTFHKTIQIHFRLPPKAEKETATPSIQYAYAPKKNNSTEENDQEGNSFSYTINWSN